MFHKTVMQRGDDDERDRPMRDTMPADGHQRTWHSPPPNRHHHPKPPTPVQPTFPSNRNPLPSSPQQNSLPPIAHSLYAPRESSSSNYYDPTQDAGDRSATRRYDSVYDRRESASYDARPNSLYEQRQQYHSPVTANFPHQALPPPLPSHSPISPKPYSAFTPSHYSERKVSQDMSPAPKQKTPSRADPMSLSAIMDNEAAPAYTPKSYERRKEPASPPPVYNPAKVTNGKSDRHDRGLEEKDIDAESARIDANLSDVETGEFDEWHQMFRQHAEKRVHELELVEETKRKRRRLNITQKLLATFEAASTQAKLNYIKDHEERAWGEVQAAEIAEEKERKKDMQRKRRREKTLAAESAKRASAIQRAAQAADAEERERLIKEAQKHEKKLRITTKLLQGETPNKELLEVTPHGPNLEGGTMSTFQASDEPKEAPRRGRAGRQSTRPRKSKEQKQAEKDAAAAAQAALDRGEELPPIAPKESARLERLAQKEAEHSQTEEPVAPPPAAAPVVDAQPFTSKSYNQLYEQIWKEIGKNVYKVHRIKNDSLTVRMSNHRKTAQLAAKEARRWQLRTNKSQKDVQARAKRSMREMVSFWKRNERDERDQRKVAERQELENAKKAEAEREANRQRRKLNFLISQTELYSHFIGKKVKTDELERTEGDGSAAPVPDTEQPADTVDGPVRNFEELDFDDDDETDLQNAARANAQHAVREAQEAAQRFNEGAFDEGEMNFQNPTSLQSMDIPQPKMLSCQLKEYQLKGLNWLVNLYEQGINGILADEMGLGKTVQSISVMSYLAENHNIWGPFLVIAPASTLHNWQQEIVKFVPDLKVLPYWGNAKDRKILRKFWDRKHITYRQDSPFHVLVTSYQLVVQDAQYFQKIKWQYMILDEAQAIKSSQSSRWKSLLGFHCRNRLLLTGTPIQNNMQELWALLHFIMPSLFDSHDEFSDWFSKDIESHAQSNTKLNEDQLKRLHMILKPFMLRRIKKHVQKELGDKIELDVFCDLTYRQRAYYTNLRNKISIMDLIEKAAVGDDQDTATLMNLVMQFRKVCNHPDLFERADTSSPFSFSHFAETASFMREGQNINVAYSVRNLIEYRVPRAIFAAGGRIDLPGPHNDKAGWRNHFLHHRGLSIWTPTNIRESARSNGAFAWQRFADVSPGEVAAAPRNGVFERALEQRTRRELGRFNVLYDGEDENTYAPSHALFNIVEKSARKPLVEATSGTLAKLFNIAQTTFDDQGLGLSEACAVPGATAPPIELVCSSQAHLPERDATFFNPLVRTALYRVPERIDEALVEEKVLPTAYPAHDLLPEPVQKHSRYTHISVPSMRRFVTDSGKLARLDALLRELKEGGHRVLLYFQMTRMIDLMEEYLTYRNYKYCRLDGSTKLEDRRDTVADFQTRPEIFVFLLSTRAGGLGINLTSADTVIFYDSDWNPTIDSQAMDRAHRLGQTRQVTVYRLITRGTIEERIRKRALQKEEVQRVVISGGAGVDFNTRSRENRTKDIALWLADDDQAAEIEKKEKEKEAEAAAVGQDGLKVPPVASRKKKAPGTAAAAAGKKKEVSMDDMYHEGEGHFDDVSAKASGAATPVDAAAGPPAKKRKGGGSKKAKTVKQRLAIADGMADPGSFQ